MITNNMDNIQKYGKSLELLRWFQQETSSVNNNIFNSTCRHLFWHGSCDDNSKSVNDLDSAQELMPMTGFNFSACAIRQRSSSCRRGVTFYSPEIVNFEVLWVASFKLVSSCSVIRSNLSNPSDKNWDVDTKAFLEGQKKLLLDWPSVFCMSLLHHGQRIGFSVYGIGYGFIIGI